MSSTSSQAEGEPTEATEIEQLSPAERIEKLKHAHSTTPHDEIPRCPQCKRQTIYQRSGWRNIDRRVNPDDDYFCNACKQTFDTPLQPGDPAYPDALNAQGSPIEPANNGGDD